MNILVIGGGAREHSICWSIKKSKKSKNIFCTPGNAGISKIAKCFNIDPKDKKKILDFCLKNNVEFVIIGPEEFLADGLSDYLIKNGIQTFGPTKSASKLESSKSFAKKFLNKHKIPTPMFKEFTSFSKAKIFLEDCYFPIVVKADGLAAGKGVIICKDKIQSIKALEEILLQKRFGQSGKKIIIEEFVEGFEISYFAFFDKKTFLPLGYALDHKKAYEDDKGPNTGGMGCFTPSNLVSNVLEQNIIKDIVKKTFDGLKRDKIVYRGVIFFGLIIQKDKAQVIEYNVRFGDPECQTLLRSLKTDLLEIFKATCEDKLSNIRIIKKKQAVVCVVLAAKGYPGKYEKNKIIKNLQNLKLEKDVEIFHAGTKLISEDFYSYGGRVLSVTAVSSDIKKARKTAYRILKQINWKNGFYRNDIGIKNY